MCSSSREREVDRVVTRGRGKGGEGERERSNH